MFTGVGSSGVFYREGETFGPGYWLHHLIPPVVTVAVPFAAWTSVLFYESLRARNGTVTWRDLLRPVALSVALIAPALLFASIAVEPAFAWPGLARLFSVRGDAGMAAALLLLYALAIVVLKLIAHVWLSRLGPPPPAAVVLNAARSARTSFFSNWIAVLGLLLCAVFAVVALAGSFIPSVNPNFIDQAHWQGYPLAPGVAGHLLGTDENGRDLLSRLVIGLRNSLAIAIFAALLATAIGLTIAKLTRALNWFAEDGALAVAGIRSFAALPFVVAAATFVVVPRNALEPVVEVLILAAVSWPAIVAAARRSSSAPRAVAAAAVGVAAGALLLEITLSLSGLGLRPPAPSLGNMLMNALSNLTIAPWIDISAVAVIIAALVALNAVADGLREPLPGPG